MTEVVPDTPLQFAVEGVDLFGALFHQAFQVVAERSLGTRLVLPVEITAIDGRQVLRQHRNQARRAEGYDGADSGAGYHIAQEMHA